MEAQRSNGYAKEPSSFTPDERIASLLQPDTVLSTQYFESIRRNRLLEPEKRLMLAILEDGIGCYLKNLFAGGAEGKRDFDEAAAWITETDGDWVFSFDSVCDALGLNPAYVREGLLGLREGRGRPDRRLDEPAPARLAV